MVSLPFRYFELMVKNLEFLYKIISLKYGLTSKECIYFRIEFL